MRQGLTPEISAAKQTNLQYLVKLRAAPKCTPETETARSRRASKDRKDHQSQRSHREDTGENRRRNHSLV